MFLKRFIAGSPWWESRRDLDIVQPRCFSIFWRCSSAPTLA